MSLFFMFKREFRGFFGFMMKLLKRINLGHLLLDISLFAISLYGSLILRLEWQGFFAVLPVANRLILPFVLIKLSILIATQCYDIVWRHVSARDAFRLVRAIGIACVAIIAVTYLSNVGRLPRSVFLIDAGLSALLITGSRILTRLYFEHSSETKYQGNERLAIIFGTGVSARALATRYQSDTHLGIRVLGFLTDDEQEIGRIIAGLKVLGTSRDLEQTLSLYPVDELIMAVETSPTELRSILTTCRRHNIKPRRTSQRGASEEGTLGTRSIELRDLLNRPSKDIDIEGIQELLKNKRVLVTGAGGSIGSEISRQVLNYGPAQLLMLDHSEYNLYQIDQELRLSKNDLSFIVPILADIKERDTLSSILHEYAPEVILHAAAYKHVHLVEGNPYPAMINNVEGTLNLLSIANEIKVSNFIQISSDKAVNPVGVMGATKRVCEMLVSEADKRFSGNYCSVRFGNVLGSSGSLIPLLQSQISANDPLTITHPETTRYFMLIPEAVSLVLTAAASSANGDIYILKMGEPIRILDIAKSLLTLTGRDPENYPLIITGLRPGEKLHEELYLSGREVNTENPDILILPKSQKAKQDENIFEEVRKLLDAARRADGVALRSLSELAHSQGEPKQGSDVEPRLEVLS